MFRKWRITPCLPISMIQEKAPTNAGMITGRIPKESNRFFAGTLTLATIYPIGTPMRIEKKTTEILNTNELRKLFWYSGEVKNLVNPSTLNSPSENFAPVFMNALSKVVIMGQNRNITRNPRGMANTR
jgi:hypothetical protein